MKANDEIKRSNLLIAIGRLGSASKLSMVSGVSSAYLSQLKNKYLSGRKRNPRTMGDDVARKLKSMYYTRMSLLQIHNLQLIYLYNLTLQFKLMILF